MSDDQRLPEAVHRLSRRSTLGVLISGLEDQYQTEALHGALAAAQEQDANLIIYSGGELDSPVKDRANGNVIYDLATDALVDSVILFTGTLVGFIDLERQVEFSDRFMVPKVSIGGRLPNAHNVLLDNEGGVRAAIRHLVEEHGYRRIAFIGGPDGNEEAALRFQAYCDALADYGRAYEPQLVAPGNFLVDDGAEAVRLLLDDRRVSFDAILACNDNMAMGALAELQKRNISVPAQTAVIGFDDIEDAVAVIPSLTTVRQPLHEEGKCGIELALALLRGETVVNPFMLHPELVIRRSCGCLQTAPMVSLTPHRALHDAPIEALLNDTKTATLTAMLGVTPNARNYHAIEALYDAFVEDILDSAPVTSVPRFIKTLDTITQELLLEQAPMDHWHKILTIMSAEVAPLLWRDRAISARAASLWQQGALVISTAVQHAEAYKQLRTRTQAKALNAIGEPLLTVTSVGELARVMAEGLPLLGVKSCHIALYEDASREWARHIFDYDSYRQQAETRLMPVAQRFRSGALMPADAYPGDRRHVLLVEALHFNNTQYGFIVLEIEHAEAYIFEALRKQISSALHTASIMQQLEEKRGQLEAALEGLKTTQSMLVHSEKMNALGQMVAGVAHEINNPIAFVNSNVHSLGQTFGDLSLAYHRLEEYARASLDPAAIPMLDTIRRDADLDFLLDDTKDLIEQTVIGLKRVKDIVTELRKFSRLDEAEFKPTNLRENVESTLVVAGGVLRNRITVEVNIDPALELTCAPAELNQVFLNMIMNAAQAIEGKGAITITAFEQGADVVIEISDSGSGIPEHVIGRIFDPFFTTKPVGVGTGLGLAISHRIIVDSHKGSIKVESQPGVGTKFILRLPKEGRK